MWLTWQGRRPRPGMEDYLYAAGAPAVERDGEIYGYGFVKVRYSQHRRVLIVGRWVIPLTRWST